MRGIKSTIALAMLASSSACAPVDATFGDAVKTDYSLQVINPDPRPAESAVLEGGSGDRAASANERYRKGETKQPQSIQTTGGGKGGGSAGSGSN
ncbi:hypothetical protein FPZ24_15230 [Sphingomonas panacisoli]|uniref:Lipoprotein n=1 Tax=Sphingomonas panacisoli TaxID=1813879 RepID=A0A5B8LKH3_9SPHN|nr:hypothetical protein [Sphingomonas panacisoli]QDZ08651.1 hypothetical protein FPZ24_15230 [Sphingomonas panacisoli]